MFNRRQVIIGAMAFTVAGCDRWLTPEEAREAGAEFKVLTADEVATLENFGEALVPGAREAGIAHYVDAQISGPPGQAMLMLRYLDVPPPFADFYKAALAKLGQSVEPGNVMARDFLAYFAIRADALDVVYGTRAGMDRLGVPVMAHIEPEAEW